MTGRLLPHGTHGLTTLQIGDRVETAGVTVTALAIDRFADLSGDRFALHMDDAAARALGFPARVAHGLLVLSLIDGLKNQAPARFDAIASLGWDIRFDAPVLVGDSLRATFTVQSRRLTGDGSRGIAVLSVKAHNQRDEVVQAGQTTLMLRL
jgi:3-hydroxybutyryl-CoA dehydratase